MKNVAFRKIYAVCISIFRVRALSRSTNPEYSIERQELVRVVFFSKIFHILGVVLARKIWKISNQKTFFDNFVSLDAIKLLLFYVSVQAGEVGECLVKNVRKSRVSWEFLVVFP